MHVDDIIVHSYTFQDHIENVEGVLMIGRDAGLTLNVAKYHLFRFSVDSLDHVVVLGRLKPSQKNTNFDLSIKDPDK